LVIEYRWAEGHYDRLAALAADLVGRRADVIVTMGAEPSAVAAKAATSTIPIVSGFSGDPVESGLVASLAHPGGNLTGFSVFTARRKTENRRLQPYGERMQQSTLAVTAAKKIVMCELTHTENRRCMLTSSGQWATPRLNSGGVLCEYEIRRWFEAEPSCHLPHCS